METEAEIIKARRARWQGAQDCWQKFAEAFLVGKRNFLFEGGEEGILTPDTVKGVIARYDLLRGKNKEADFIDAATDAYSEASRPEKLVFAHALFIYKLIVKPKTVNEANIGKKQNFVNCLNLGNFVGDLHWNGVAHTGQTCNECSVSVDYILKILKHLAEKHLKVEATNAEIRTFCEEQYRAKEKGVKGVKWMVDILLWYVAPDEYEPIISREAKEKIVKCPELIGLIEGNPKYADEDIAGMVKDEFMRNKLIHWIRRETVESNRAGDKKFNFYDSNVRTLWEGEQKMTEEQNERKFRKWMKEKGGKTPGAIDNYVSALKSKLSKIAKENGLIDGGTLFGIQEQGEFERVKKELEAKQEFIEIKEKSQRVHSSALDRYGDYLAYKEAAQGNGDSSVDEDSEKNGNNAMQGTKQTPLNQIFYGPPGTGKTYGVVEKALKIVGCNIPEDDEEEGEDKEEEERKRRERRKAQMALFNKLLDEGQIAMVTFHQNFSYEDFIEGIKPELDSADDSLSYEMKRGVFKIIAERANENRRNSGDSSERSVDVVELVERYAEYLEEENKLPILIGKGEDGELKIKGVNRNQEDQFKSFVLSLPNGGKTSFTVAPIKCNYELFKSNPNLLAKDIRSVDPSKTSYGGNKSRLLALLKVLHQFDVDNKITFSEEIVERKNYVLIIDEINRGNVSAIFGELITLLEEDKRLGRENALRLTLPYSKEPFGVPDNLHIIGTMNTADRSIALLDTALRRRFHFVEMMPDPQKATYTSVISGIDCGKLLEAINERIRFWYDREHQIGHAYLMYLQEIEELKAAFQQKIIPLLQEYFFDDWEKIDLVLNKNGFIEKKPTEINGEEKTLYSKLPFGDGAWDKAKNYQEIYKKKNLQADDE